MLKIAIIDDDKDFLKLYKELVNKIFSEHHVMTETQAFVYGAAFINSLSIVNYDLVFMDIDMPELSGIDIVSKLRNNNFNFDLIFVSAHSHFVFEAIKLTPYRFIRKTNLKEETKEAIGAYCNRKQIQFKMIPLELQNGEIVKEKIMDIIQFFSIRHDVFYSSKNQKMGVILSRKYSLSKIEHLTKDLGFIRVHRSYLVNYKYIKKIDSKSLLLTDESEVPISHGKMTDIQEQFMTLLRNEDIV